MKFEPVAGTLVIGFGYRAQHGKDLAAKIIAERAGADVHRFAVSDAISAVARACHGMTQRDSGLLQRVGFQYREERPGVWLRALYGAVADRHPAVALITGVRFPDEADMVRSMGGVVVNVSRFNTDGSPFVAGDRDPNHPTEHGLDGFRFDHALYNVTGRIDDFEADTLALFRAICERRKVAA